MSWFSKGKDKIYRGRIAPSPSGYLHLGHASTFQVAYKRAKEEGGKVILRNEDIDRERSRNEYSEAIIEDLLWLGINWDEGPFLQSERKELYLSMWRNLKQMGYIYPCYKSRKDLEHLERDENGEVIFPINYRNNESISNEYQEPGKINWRFRVPEGKVVEFADRNLGPQRYIAGKDFGDFLVWRRLDEPSYELAVTFDDHDMEITEVVRGADLLKSTARQVLIYKAMSWKAPEFYHCPLVCDNQGKRLSKSSGSMSIRELRKEGFSAKDLYQKITL